MLYLVSFGQHVHPSIVLTVKVDKGTSLPTRLVGIIVSIRDEVSNLVVAHPSDSVIRTIHQEDRASVTILQNDVDKGFVVSRVVRDD